MTRRRIINALKVALSLLALGCVGLYAYRLWPGLAARAWHLDWPLVALSVLLLLLTQVLLMGGWRQSVIAAGGRHSWIGAARSQAIGQLGKYVPGKVVTMVGKVYFAHQDGVQEDTAATAVFIETCAEMATTAALAALYLFGAGAAADTPLLRLLWVGPLALALLHPRSLRLIARLAARIARRPPPELQCRWRDSLALLAAYSAVFITWGLALYALALGMGASCGALTAIGANALGWLGGFLSYIFPGGLGVREAVIAHLLGPQTGLTVAAGISVASRAALLLCELGTGAVCAFLRVRREDKVSMSSQAAAGRDASPTGPSDG